MINQFLNNFNESSLKVIGLTIFSIIPSAWINAVMIVVIQVSLLEYIQKVQLIAAMFAALLSTILILYNIPKVFDVYRKIIINISKGLQLKKSIIIIIDNSKSNFNILSSELKWSSIKPYYVNEIEDIIELNINYDVIILSGNYMNVCDRIRNANYSNKPVIRISANIEACKACDSCNYVLHRNHSREELSRLILKCI